MKNIVLAWFGESFYRLHPQLQKLHLTGGYLSGEIRVLHPIGIAGFFGRNIAKKMKIPLVVGPQPFSVFIAAKEDGLHWSRCFNSRFPMHSIFKPVGTRDAGYWQETTGALILRLGVDIDAGGWYWRCKKVTYRGIPLPMVLFPKMTAYKTVIDGYYKFYVGFSMPLLGEVLSYSGLLTLSESV